MGYETPADVGISDDWQDHVNRKSVEPGTDYKTPYGTDLRMPGDGVVVYADNSNAGADGRRLEINMDDGRVIDLIHLSQVNVKSGTRVSRGQTGVCLSGASGYGSDWYYGPHVHVTLRARTGLPLHQTLDFELYVGDEPHVPAFPLPSGWYFGPKEGPRNCVSGYYGNGEHLARWQARMKERGWAITVDGRYGPQTREVCIAFQKEKGLNPDGLIGSITWQAAWTAPIT